MPKDGKNNITSIHTFADDVTRLTGEEAVTDTETMEPITADAQPEEVEAQTEPTVPAKVEQEPPAPVTPTQAPQKRSPSVPIDRSKSASSFLEQEVPQTEPAKTQTQTPTAAESAPTKTATPKEVKATSADHAVPEKSQGPSATSKARLSDVLADDLEQHTTASQQTPTSLDSDLEVGTIIRDKKQKKHRLFPAIWKNITDTVERWTAPKEVPPAQRVSSSESRREVISNAAKQSYNVPDNDFVTVQKSRANQAPPTTAIDTKSVQIKKAQDTETARWAHYVDDEATTDESVTATSTDTSEDTGTPNNLPTQETQTTETKERAPQYTSTNPEEVTESQTNIMTPEEADTVTTTKVTDEEQDQAAVAANAPEDATSAWDAAPKTETETPEDSSIDTSQSATAEPVTTPPPAAEPVEEPAADTTATTFPAEFQDPTANTGSWWREYVSRFAVVFVIIGAVGLGASTAFFWFGNVTTESTNRIVSVPSLIPTNFQVAVPLGDDRLELLQHFADATNRATAVTQMYPVYDIESEPLVPANTADILTTITFRAPGNFMRGITNATFGSTESSQPFLIIRVQDFDTAFAGLLTWEAAMSADLAPWFGAPVTQTFDPDARTRTQLRPAFFTDTLQNNNTVRLLRDAKEQERITYGFVTPQIVLITTTLETYRSLEQEIRN